MIEERAIELMFQRNPYFDTNGYAIFWHDDTTNLESPILLLKPSNSDRPTLLAPFKRVQLRNKVRLAALLPMTEDVFRFYGDQSKSIAAKHQLQHDYKQKVEELRFFQLNSDFREWLASDIQDRFKDTSEPETLQEYPFSILDYLETGRVCYLHPRFCYGDRSDLATNWHKWFSNNSSKLFSKFSKDQSLTDNEKLLLRSFEAIRSAFVLSRSTETKDFFRNQCIEDLEHLLCEGIAELNYYSRELTTRHPCPRTPFSRFQTEDFLTEALNKIGEYKSHTLGFWMAVEMCKQLASLTSNDPSSMQGMRFFAETATLYHQQIDEDTKKGQLLWFSVELFKDNPGKLVPDLTSLGLTDVSELFKHIETCWDASGLASEFRGVWRLSTQYKGKDVPFRHYSPKSYLKRLEGGSLQAAALIALWAAAGRDPHYFGQDQQKLSSSSQVKSLRLIPSVAISASICWDCLNHDNRDCSIKLAPILDESIVSKIEALRSYSNSHDPEECLFSDAIIVGKDVTTVEEKFSESIVAPPNYRGIRIRTKCSTIGDAMEWMLHVNSLTRKLNQKPIEDWESSWASGTGTYGEIKKFSLENEHASEESE